MNAMRFAAALAVTFSIGGPVAAQSRAACRSDNAGLTLPQGFCALIVADSVGGPRHIAVAANGDVFVALRGPR